jgi:hypothetical protein
MQPDIADLDLEPALLASLLADKRRFRQAPSEASQP